jgi:hypothetical protein
VVKEYGEEYGLISNVCEATGVEVVEAANEFLWAAKELDKSSNVVGYIA